MVLFSPEHDVANEANMPSPEFLSKVGRLRVDKSALNQTARGLRGDHLRTIPISVSSHLRAPHMALPQTKLSAEVKLANLAGRYR
jgi:hypothetical protein